VNWKGSQLIISFFIVGLRVSCGMQFSLGSACVGLYLVASRSCMLLGGWVANPEVPLCGRWFLFASCGASRMREMLDVSRTHLGTLRTLFTSSCTPFSLGLLAG
jgi:hypothetical protein